MHTSIIMPVQAEGELVARCLQALRSCTHPPYELIVVSNQATEETLAHVRQNTPDHLIALTTPHPIGHCLNQGLERATGTRVVLLDAASCVTPGWLEGLLAGLDTATEVAASGPMTNLALTNLDQVVAPDYEDEASMIDFAARRAQALAGQSLPARVLDLFCMALEGWAIEQTGPFDESLSLFLAQDYCLRLRLRRLQLRLMPEVFVHRHNLTVRSGEHRYDAEGEGFRQEMERDHLRFQAKWQHLHGLLRGAS